MGGIQSKRAGSSFEYRLANWFSNRPNWQGFRNPLSGASEQINELVSKHDVRAWHSTLPIFLQIEAKKKTGKNKKTKDEIIIQRKWIDKIDFTKDEILVVSTDRSDMYVFLPIKRFFQILGRTYSTTYDKSQIYTGEQQFIFKRESVDDSTEKRYHLQWMGQEWIVLLLEEFVALRETANLYDDLSIEDQIKRLIILEKAVEFEELNIDTLSYNQKRLLYSKLAELESGSALDPISHSNDQFWLDDAFILACPHCEEKITKKDLSADPKS